MEIPTPGIAFSFIPKNRIQGNYMKTRDRNPSARVLTAPHSRIEDYALIGDCETAALVSKGGSIDWLCWPNFSSAAWFAALLGGPANGRWMLAPKNKFRVQRNYQSHTLILETTFITHSGEVRVTDFMPSDKRSFSPRISRDLSSERSREPTLSERSKSNGDLRFLHPAKESPKPL